MEILNIRNTNIVQKPNAIDKDRHTNFVYDYRTDVDRLID